MSTKTEKFKQCCLKGPARCEYTYPVEILHLCSCSFTDYVCPNLVIRELTIELEDIINDTK